MARGDCRGPSGLDSVPNDAMPVSMIGVAAASLGDTAAARGSWPSLTDPRRDTPLHRYEAAKIAAALGERARAIELLAAAFASGRRHTFWDHSALRFEPLRDLPAYQDLIQPKQ